MKERKEAKTAFCLGGGVPVCCSGVYRQARDTFFFILLSKDIQSVSFTLRELLSRHKRQQNGKIIMFRVAIVVKFYLENNLDNDRNIDNYSVIREKQEEK